MFYSQRDIREILGVSRAYVYMLMKQPDFPKFRIGKRILVPIDEFNRWLDEQKKGDAKSE